ncbi:hypothetical protein BC826DRAFT_1104064 [Russula brevipes]|nr:hypothetical protein BC826DRAFT_1104064 [Russula brevipes]
MPEIESFIDFGQRTPAEHPRSLFTSARSRGDRAPDHNEHYVVHEAATATPVNVLRARCTECHDDASPTVTTDYEDEDDGKWLILKALTGQMLSLELKLG